MVISWITACWLGLTVYSVQAQHNPMVDEHFLNDYYEHDLNGQGNHDSPYWQGFHEGGDSIGGFPNGEFMNNFDGNFGIPADIHGFSPARQNYGEVPGNIGGLPNGEFVNDFGGHFGIPEEILAPGMHKKQSYGNDPGNMGGLHGDFVIPKKNKRSNPKHKKKQRFGKDGGKTGTIPSHEFLKKIGEELGLLKRENKTTSGNQKSQGFDENPVISDGFLEDQLVKNFDDKKGPVKIEGFTEDELINHINEGFEHSEKEVSRKDGIKKSGKQNPSTSSVEIHGFSEDELIKHIKEGFEQNEQEVKPKKLTKNSHNRIHRRLSDRDLKRDRERTKKIKEEFKRNNKWLSKGGTPQIDDELEDFEEFPQDRILNPVTEIHHMPFMADHRSLIAGESIPELPDIPQNDKEFWEITGEQHPFHGKPRKQVKAEHTNVKAPEMLGNEQNDEAFWKLTGEKPKSLDGKPRRQFRAKHRNLNTEERLPEMLGNKQRDEALWKLTDQEPQPFHGKPTHQVKDEHRNVNARGRAPEMLSNEPSDEAFWKLTGEKPKSLDGKSRRKFMTNHRNVNTEERLPEMLGNKQRDEAFWKLTDQEPQPFHGKPTHQVKDEHRNVNARGRAPETLGNEPSDEAFWKLTGEKPQPFNGKSRRKFMTNHRNVNAEERMSDMPGNLPNNRQQEVMHGGNPQQRHPRRRAYSQHLEATVDNTDEDHRVKEDMNRQLVRPFVKPEKNHRKQRRDGQQMRRSKVSQLDTLAMEEPMPETLVEKELRGTEYVPIFSPEEILINEGQSEEQLQPQHVPKKRRKKSVPYKPEEDNMDSLHAETMKALKAILAKATAPRKMRKRSNRMWFEAGHMASQDGQMRSEAEGRVGDKEVLDDDSMDIRLAPVEREESSEILEGSVYQDHEIGDFGHSGRNIINAASQDAHLVREHVAREKGTLSMKLTPATGENKLQRPLPIYRNLENEAKIHQDSEEVGLEKSVDNIKSDMLTAAKSDLTPKTTEEDSEDAGADNIEQEKYLLLNEAESKELGRLLQNSKDIGEDNDVVDEEEDEVIFMNPTESEETVKVPQESEDDGLEDGAKNFREEEALLLAPAESEEVANIPHESKDVGLENGSENVEESENRLLTPAENEESEKIPKDSEGDSQDTDADTFNGVLDALLALGESEETPKTSEDSEDASLEDGANNVEEGENHLLAPNESEEVAKIPQDSEDDGRYYNADEAKDVMDALLTLAEGNENPKISEDSEDVGKENENGADKSEEGENMLFSPAEIMETPKTLEDSEDASLEDDANNVEEGENHLLAPNESEEVAKIPQDSEDDGRYYNADEAKDVMDALLTLAEGNENPKISEDSEDVGKENENGADNSEEGEDLLLTPVEIQEPAKVSEDSEDVGQENDILKEVMDLLLKAAKEKKSAKISENAENVAQENDILKEVMDLLLKATKGEEPAITQQDSEDVGLESDNGTDNVEEGEDLASTPESNEAANIPQEDEKQGKDLLLNSAESEETAKIQERIDKLGLQNGVDNVKQIEEVKVFFNKGNEEEKPPVQIVVDIDPREKFVEKTRKRKKVERNVDMADIMVARPVPHVDKPSKPLILHVESSDFNLKPRKFDKHNTKAALQDAQLIREVVGREKGTLKMKLSPATGESKLQRPLPVYRPLEEYTEGEDAISPVSKDNVGLQKHPKDLVLDDESSDFNLKPGKFDRDNTKAALQDAQLIREVVGREKGTLKIKLSPATGESKLQRPLPVYRPLEEYTEGEDAISPLSKDNVGLQKHPIDLPKTNDANEYCKAVFQLPIKEQYKFAHPTDCTYYFYCLFGSSVEETTGTREKCAPNYRFSTSLLSCVRAWNPADICASDPCEDPTSMASMRQCWVDNTKCRILYSCSRGWSYPTCCPAGTIATEFCTCEKNATCLSDCEGNPVEAEASTKFRPCATYLPFDNDFNDQSVNDVQVKPSGLVKISKSIAAVGTGSAFFNGGRLELEGVNKDLGSKVSWCLLFRCSPDVNNSTATSCRTARGALLSDAVNENLDSSVTMRLRGVRRLVRLQTSSPVRVLTAASSKSLAPTDWHQLCVIYDGKNIVLFEDGKLTQTARGSKTPMSIRKVGTPYSIGAGKTRDGAFVGYIDEVLVCQDVLGEKEMEAHRNGNRDKLVELGLIPA